MEIITIPVKRAIGSEFAVYSYNALKLLKMIEKEIDKKREVILDFDGIEVVTFDFIGMIYTEIYRKCKNLDIVELTSNDEEIMERFIVVKNQIERIRKETMYKGVE